jgi:hypothetical protein
MAMEIVFLSASYLLARAAVRERNELVLILLVDSVRPTQLRSRHPVGTSVHVLLARNHTSVAGDLARGGWGAGSAHGALKGEAALARDVLASDLRGVPCGDKNAPDVRRAPCFMLTQQLFLTRLLCTKWWPDTQISTNHAVSIGFCISLKGWVKG